MILKDNRTVYTVMDQYANLSEHEIELDFISTPLYVSSSFYRIEYWEDGGQWCVIEMEKSS